MIECSIIQMIQDDSRSSPHDVFLDRTVSLARVPVPGDIVSGGSGETEFSINVWRVELFEGGGVLVEAEPNADARNGYGTQESIVQSYLESGWKKH